MQQISVQKVKWASNVRILIYSVRFNFMLIPLGKARIHIFYCMRERYEIILLDFLSHEMFGN